MSADAPDEEGLYLVEDGEFMPLHTTGSNDDEDKLEEYLNEWDLI